MSHLSVLELDFDEVKDALLTYLQAQTEFLDYDFTGSALNTIIDLLAYFIHYAGVQANFALRESFLESAQLRKNVATIAKELGYFPAQAKSAKTNFKLTLDLTGQSSPPTTITVPRGTVFVSKLENGSTITFVTFDDNPLVDEGVAAGNPATKILSGTVFIAQGTISNKFFIVNDFDQRFILDQPNIDTDFLSVSIRPNEASLDVTAWEHAKKITTVGPSTEAFFISEYGDSIEIYFGNNSIGKALNIGNFIDVEYIVTQGSQGNGLSQFELSQNIATYARNLFTISNVEKTGEGADRESLDSIRFIAPLSYQRQNRIVTIDDYKSAVLENFSNVRAINAWGGEDADPPEFGKVFVSVAPVVGDKVSPTTKKSIERDILSRFNVVGITPQIVDPEYLTINLITTAFYRKDKTILKPSQIASLAQGAIEDYFLSSVFDYKQSFKYSKLLTAVDAVHSSIINSLTDVTISKSFIVTSNVSATYTIKFLNALKEQTIQSNIWLNTGSNNQQIKSSATINGNIGQLDLYINDTLTKTNVGTVDHTTGLVTLTGFNPNALTLGQIITFTAEPAIPDVSIQRNNLARLGTNVVTMEATER